MIAHESKINRPTSDLELERRILIYLRRRVGYLSDLEIEAQDGRVMLRGTVPYPSVQRRCIDCCRSVAGVLDVIDRLVVSPLNDSNDSVASFVRSKPR
jgi:hypothetical protein